MRNVISIDSRYDCVCNAVVSTDTKTDEIVLEVITGDSTNPYIKLIVNDESYYIKLKANQSNYVNITSESWVLGESIQFQYVNNEYEGTLFTLNFPAIIKDITISQTGETEFTVKSLINSTRALMLEDIVNDLTSTDIYKVLSANMGSVLNGKIGDANALIDALAKYVNPITKGVSLTDSDFDNLGDKPLIGIGTRMANDPVGNTAVRYLVVHIPAYNNYETVQLAKSMNYGTTANLFYYRQQKHDGSWSNWTRFATGNDIASVKSQFISSSFAYSDSANIVVPKNNVASQLGTITIPAKCVATVKIRANVRTANSTIGFALGKEGDALTSYEWASKHQNVTQYYTISSTWIYANNTSAEVTLSVMASSSIETTLMFVSAQAICTPI